MNILIPLQTLTAREERVAAEYASGLSHREVALKLGVSSSTVRTHIAAVYRKLRVANKVQLGGVLSPVHAAEKLPGLGIAVLDFAHPPGAPNATAGWIADGIASALSRFRSLSVIPRLAVQAAAEGPPDWRAAAEDTGARYLVIGRVLQAGRRIRVTAELIDGVRGVLIWSRSFDHEVADLFGFIDDMSRKLAATLAFECEASELARMRGPVGHDASSWEIYCHALRLFWRDMAGSRDEVIQQCLLALEKDAAFAAPHILISRCHCYGVTSARSVDPATSARKGLDHAQQAIAIDGRDDAAFMLLGYNLGIARRYDDAEEAIAQGLALNPNNSGLYNTRANLDVYSPFGDLARARADEQMALGLGPNDPTLWTYYTTLGVIDLADEAAGDVAEAVRNLQRAVLLPNADWQAHFALAMGYVAMDRTSSASRHLRLAREKLGHLDEADLSCYFGGLQSRSLRFSRLSEQTLALGGGKQ